MKNWTEFHIGIVYYSGIIVSLLSAVLILIYLKPIKRIFAILQNKYKAIWSISFKTTIIIAGLLGAMVVSFRDCNGKYDYLLDSSYKTIHKGLDQLSSSFNYLLTILILWLVIFLVLFLVQKKEKN